MNEVCCTISAGPFEIDVPMPQEAAPGPDGKPAAGENKGRDWNGFAQAIIAILQALSQILGPIIGPHGAQNQPAGASGDKPGQRPQR